MRRLDGRQTLTVMASITHSLNMISSPPCTPIQDETLDASRACGALHACLDHDRPLLTTTGSVTHSIRSGVCVCARVHVCVCMCARMCVRVPERAHAGAHCAAYRLHLGVEDARARQVVDFVPVSVE